MPTFGGAVPNASKEGSPGQLAIVGDHELEIEGFRFKQFVASARYCVGVFPAPEAPLEMQRPWISSVTCSDGFIPSRA